MANEIHFDFIIHHSGSFERNPGLKYVGGEVYVKGDIDPVLLRHFEIHDICVDAGGPINSRIYYLIHGSNLEQVLSLITSDDDVTYMLNVQQIKSHFM